MARIAGINIPQNKIVRVGLNYIYGIGNKHSQKICNNLINFITIIALILVIGSIFKLNII